VDHSIVESFAQGGKLCITSRVYPTKAIGEDAHLFVFNTGAVHVHIEELEAWEMETIQINTIS
jgi:beta-fructofuranosidase